METSLKASYRNLLIINLGLIAGVVLFFLVSLLMMDFKIPEFKSGWDPVNIVSVLLFGAIPIAVRVTNSMLAKIDPEKPVHERFGAMQTALIIRWAFINGPTLFSIVGLILLEDLKQIVIFLLCLLMFFYYAVSKEKVALMLKLNEEEARKFRAEGVF